MTDRLPPKAKKNPHQIADALRIISTLVGPRFTGVLQLHFKEGEFQIVKLPPEELTREDLNL